MMHAILFYMFQYDSILLVLLGKIIEDSRNTLLLVSGIVIFYLLIYFSTNYKH